MCTCRESYLWVLINTHKHMHKLMATFNVSTNINLLIRFVFIHFSISWQLYNCILMAFLTPFSLEIVVFLYRFVVIIMNRCAQNCLINNNNMWHRKHFALYVRRSADVIHPHRLCVHKLCFQLTFWIYLTWLFYGVIMWYTYVKHIQNANQQNICSHRCASTR